MLILKNAEIRRSRIIFSFCDNLFGANFAGATDTPMHRAETPEQEQTQIDPAFLLLCFGVSVVLLQRFFLYDKILVSLCHISFTCYHIHLISEA